MQSTATPKRCAASSGAVEAKQQATGLRAASGDGVWMHALCTRLYPIMRSLTGEGLRETLRIVGESVPLTLTEVPSGQPAFDWTVPKEWNVREAWIADASGRRIVDVADHTLHLMNYSAPFRGRMSLEQLRPRLHSLPDRPDWIPYRTSYFKEDWAFCLTDRQLQSLPDGDYDVCVDTTLEPGSLTFGECVIPGDTDEEVFLTAHACHPSLVNDNLSGITVLARLAQYVMALERRRYTYRFLWVPATVGAITYLSVREPKMTRMRHGVVVSGVGDPGAFNYKKSRRGDSAIDRVMASVLRESGVPHAVNPFMPYGYDERQYCSPGLNLPVGCLSRSTYGSYPEYHTSGDNLTFVQAHCLQESLDMLLRAVSLLERDRVLLNLNPKCEPQLGRRGLYSLIGGHNESQKLQLALLWVLNLSDGHHSLLDIAERAELPFDLIDTAAQALLRTDLARDAG